MLDAEIARAGLVPALQLAAIDIDVEAERYDVALRRVDSLLAQSPGHPTWASRRAEILTAAGRAEEAREAYREALSFVEARTSHRNSRRLAELEGEIRKALASSSATRQEELQ
jgi:predicted Zn-dependent protease